MGTLAQVMEGRPVAVNGGDPPLVARKMSRHRCHPVPPPRDPDASFDSIVATTSSPAPPPCRPPLPPCHNSTISCVHRLICFDELLRGTLYLFLLIYRTSVIKNVSYIYQIINLGIMLIVCALMCNTSQYGLVAPLHVTLREVYSHIGLDYCYDSVGSDILYHTAKQQSHRCSESSVSCPLVEWFPSKAMVCEPCAPA